MEKGHLKAVCSKYAGENGRKSNGQFFINDSDNREDFYKISCDREDKLYRVSLKVCEYYMNFEVDTGCRILAISLK